MPPTQLWPLVHARAQAPQLETSVSRLTHALEQYVIGALHPGIPPRHTPSTHPSVQSVSVNIDPRELHMRARFAATHEVRPGVHTMGMHVPVAASHQVDPAHSPSPAQRGPRSPGTIVSTVGGVSSTTIMSGAGSSELGPSWGWALSVGAMSVGNTVSPVIEASPAVIRPPLPPREEQAEARSRRTATGARRFMNFSGAEQRDSGEEAGGR
jgi:hypothetical protein